MASVSLSVLFVNMCQNAALQTVQLCVHSQKWAACRPLRAPVSCLIWEFEGLSLEGAIAMGSPGGWCTSSIRMNASSRIKQHDTCGFKSCV